MTIDTEPLDELTIDRICELGYRASGLMNEHQRMSSARANVARQFLGLVLEDLQSQGIPIRTQSFVTVGPLVAGTSQYALESNVLDVIGTPVYIPADSDPETPSTQIQMIRVDQELYQTLTAKDTTGPPLQVYVYRAVGPLQIWLWPIPSEAGYVKLRVQRLFARVTNGSKTVDLEQPWSMYLVYAMAHELARANSQPLAKCQDLERRAGLLLQRCKGFGSEHVDTDVVVYHPTPWNR